MPLADRFPATDLPRETTEASHVAWEGHHLTLRVDDVALPSGRRSQRHVVERGPSVVVIAVTTDDHVLLVRQYRYAVGERLVELPAGMIDPGESSLEAAARELWEETGHVATTLRELASVYLSPGFTTERSTFVLADGCAPAPFDPDPDEPLHVAHVPLAEVPALLEPGASPIVQAQAMLGLLWLLHLRAG